MKTSSEKVRREQTPFKPPSLFMSKTLWGNVFSPVHGLCLPVFPCTQVYGGIVTVFLARVSMQTTEKLERPINSHRSVCLGWDDGGRGGRDVGTAGAGWRERGRKEKPLQGIEPNMWSLILALDSKWRGLAEHLGRCLWLEEFNTDKTCQTSLKKRVNMMVCSI